MLLKMPHVSRTNLGEYLTSFFLIRLDTDLRDGIKLDDQLTKEEMATFVHEYLHFLQDVTTTSGLTRFNSISKLIQTVVAGIYEAESTVTLPYRLDRPNEKNAEAELELQEFYLGSDEYVPNCIVDHIEFERECCLDDFVPDPKGINAVNLYYNTEKAPYVFGSICIRESISYLIEHLRFGAESRTQELPYNSCEMVCKYLYPELADRKDVLVLLAERSLASLHSGQMFVQLITILKQRGAAKFSLARIMSICLDQTEYLESAYERASQDNTRAVDFLYPPNTPFHHANLYLKRLLKGGHDYHKKYNFPMFIFLLLNERGAELYLKTMLREIGLPLIASRQNETFSTEEDLSYFLVPIALYQLSYTLMPSKCYLYPYCIAASHPCFEEAYCCYSPWKQVKKERLCPFAAFWYHYSLSGKEIAHK